MALFDDASLVVTPNGYKEGTLYSIKPTSGLGDMTVVRATTATRVNSAGLIELVPYNLVTYSEQFDNADWGKEFTTITANNITAPDGMLTADRFNLSSGTEQKFLYQGATQNGTYTQSVYLKKGTHTFVQLAVGGDVNPYCNFDLTNGTFSAFGSTATMTNVGDEWYRCTMTYTSSVATYVYIFASDSLSSARTPSTSSTGNFYAWGAQLVTGSLPKDYLRTETRLNIPRLDYSNGTCPSLLVEPQRTNSVLFSEQFTNAAWADAGGTVTANTAISPSGYQDADTLTGARYQGGGAANQYTLSCFAKKVDGDGKFVLRVDVPTLNFAQFNLNNGTIDSTSAGYTSTITSVGNGWYRCTLTTPVSTTISNFVLISATGATFSTYVWGAQSEIGAYATSYIPTTSASVTRNADVISKTGISSLIGQTEGVLFFDFVYNELDTNGLIPITLANDSINNVYCFIESNNRINFNFVIGGADVLNIQTATSFAVKGTRYKIALAYKANDFAVYINGVLIGTQNTGAVIGFNDFYFGYPFASGYNYPLNTNSVILFPTRLTNAELAQLTTI